MARPTEKTKNSVAPPDSKRNGLRSKARGTPPSPEPRVSGRARKRGAELKGRAGAEPAAALSSLPATSAKKRPGCTAKRSNGFSADELDAALAVAEDVGLGPQFSRFEKEFQSLRDSAGSGNAQFDSDDLTARSYRAMLSMVLELVPVAEVKYRESRREQDAYALNALINQTVTLSGLLRGFTDQQDKASHIAQRIIAPAMVLLAQQLMVAMTTVQAAIDGAQLKPGQSKGIKDALAGMMRGYAGFLAQQSGVLADSVSSFLTGGSAQTALPAPGKKVAKKAPAKPRAAKKAAANIERPNSRPAQKKPTARKRKADEGVLDVASLM